MLNNTLTELITRSLTGITLLIAVGGAYLHSSLLFMVCLTSLLLITLITEWPRLVNLRRPSRILFTLLYPVVPFCALISLTNRYYSTDFYLPLLPFIFAWSADTGGYILGKLIGYHKMCPTVSPGKSWEGFAGSIVSVYIACWYFFQKILLLTNSPLKSNFCFTLFFAIVITTIAFLGGFFLSLLKRKQGLKDAGTLLPGHGGILDRFDGVLFVGLAIQIMLLWHSF
jgi:phosphatidate cytidylyltransferase